MNYFEERLGKNIDRIKTNMIAGEELSSAFASSATNLARRDQAECVHNLKSKVLAEVKYLIDMESSGKLGAIKAKLVSTPLSFAAGGFIGMLLHHHDPLATALKAVGSSLGRNYPFGTVLIALGKAGLPDDVKVIPLSCLARESKMSESEVRAILADKGDFLITQEVFAATMDEVEHCVLNGVLSFPLPVTEFKKRIQVIIPGSVTPVPGNKLHRSTKH
ncbi:hypothetical protein ACFLTV_02200 [Chloroflexota bacterium]